MGIKEPFFNLVVPTRNRADTLIWTLKSLLLNEYPHYQIIVSDNFSDDLTSEVVKSLNSDKIVYFKTETKLSMVDNFEFAISKAEKGYVMVIGDDDGLVPDALTFLAKIINKYDPELFIGKNLIYYWDSYKDDMNKNTFLVPKCSNSVYWVESDFILKEASEWLYITNFRYLNYLRMPMLYHGGCTKVELINKIKNRDGRFYQTLFPDYYSAFILTAEVEKFLFIDGAYFITGSSGNSTGHSAQLNENKNKNSNISIFLNENSFTLNPPLEFFSSFTLYTLDSILTASKFNKKIKKMFNWENAIKKMTDDAYQKNDLENFDLSINKIKNISLKVNKLEYFNSLIKKPFQTKKKVRKINITDSNYFIYETNDIQNIYESSVFNKIQSLNYEPKYIENTKLYFFKLKLLNLYQRIQNKIKNYLN